MTALSATKQQLLQQINQSRNAQVDPNVKSMLETVNNQTYSLSQRFKNLEDPLKFIHNQRIQNLVEKTEESSFKLKKQMDDISQFSKSMFKKIISRQRNEFNFQNIKQQKKALQNSQIKQTELIKAQSMCKLRQTGNGQNYMKKQASIEKMKKMKVFEPLSPVSQYKHQNDQVRQIKRESSKNAKFELNFGHIKLMQTQQFDSKCKNVEFYDILKSSKDEIYHQYNQEYDIENSVGVNKLCNKIPLDLIGNDCEYSPFSQVLYYDFDLNLRFWKQSNRRQQKKGAEEKLENEKITDETTLALFYDFTKKQINVKNLCDIAMGKISVYQLRHFLDLKNYHKTKLKGKNDQNIQDQYALLLKQYQYQNQLKTKMNSQIIPVKNLDSESQTMNYFNQKDFDDYFNQNFKQLFIRLSKLSRVRQNGMTNKKLQNRTVLIKNSCLEISECLFKLLTLILKGEKFYPRQKANEKNYAPFFTYRDLFDAENRDNVERKILELIYCKINQFECEFVDDIPKSDLIAIYVEQRQKTNRILDIISAQ